MPSISGCRVNAEFQGIMIRINELKKSFNEKIAVDGITFDVARGAVFGFLGPNGAGKTTTLRILMGLLQPDSGRVEIDGIDVAADPIAVRARVGYLPDEIFLYDYLTGYQFLDFVADVHQLPKTDRKARIEELLAQFGLSEAANEYTANYSFGMKKKMALASIIIHAPKVLILDEPFNGLDPQATRDFRLLLDKMVENDTTIIFSSHVLEVVEKLVTHVGIIASGRLRLSESIENVTQTWGSLEKAFFELTDPAKQTA
ncbi:MAG: ABC transporter ATP-binding protein [Candidatus Riflebacteria bacterium HGW-Riflebacteria-1]|nr:MAG: ABC transporter ATP-binding protein [Candidatus Riflebacteria bacterium HGW-Riflebacteria-1]